MSDSIHVPGQTVKRIKALAKLFIPVVTIAAATAWTTTVTWFRTRPSTAEVQKLTADCTTIAKEAQDQGKTNHVQIYALQQTALKLAETAIELHAQAEVARAYGKSPHLPEYIDRARKFYANEFARELDERPGDIVRSLAQARRAVWRPDRD